MYSLILGGGLGNQMFQYAYARCLQEKYGIEFAFNLYSYELNNTEIEERTFALEPFNIKKNIEFQSKKDSIKAYNRYRISLKRKIFVRKFGIPNKVAQSLADIGCICSITDPYSYFPVTIKKMDGVIYGGFQSEKHFSEIKDIIRQELHVKKESSEDNQKLIEIMRNKNSIAVHIRRGDYLAPRYKHLNVCNYDYYKTGVKIFQNKIPNPIFFVFSNTEEDINWIKKNYNFLPENTVYISGNRDYEDMQLMYNCKHFVISNSTFSWWGQYLSDNSSKIVVAPSEWNKSSPNGSRHIYQENWICIGDVNENSN